MRNTRLATVLGLSGCLAVVTGLAHAAAPRALSCEASRVAPSDERPDDELPDITAPELADRMRRSMKSYETGYLEAEFVEEQNTNGWGTGGDDEPIIVKFPGRIRYATDGQHWQAEYDGKIATVRTRTLRPFHWLAGFDGEVHYLWDDRRVAFGEVQPGARTLQPRELFWSSVTSSSRRELESLAKSQLRVTGQRTMKGYRCYVLEWASPDNPSWRHEYVVSPRQAFLMVRSDSFRNDTLRYTHQLHDLETTDRGVWVPRRIVTESRSVKDDGSWKPDRRRDTRVVSFDPNRTFADGHFRLDLPVGVDVEDYRSGMAYRNDPWWPEVAALVGERFNWPRRELDLYRLRDLSSNADPRMQGKDAPPIEAAEWLGKPVDWPQLRGKVTLVYFSTASLIHPDPQWSAALRRLYEIYKPAGLEMLGVVAAPDDIDIVKQSLRELRPTYTVAIDAPSGDRQGKTFAAFGMNTYIGATLVDHEGRIRQVQSGQLVDTLVDLLRQSGAKDVEPIALNSASMTREMADAVERAWHEWVRRAPATGKVTGKVTDGRGPLPLTDIDAKLQFRMLSSSTLGGYFVIPFRDRNFRVTTEADGSYELNGLPKGTYEVRLTAPGKAIVERTVAIRPDLHGESLDAVLEQADGIAGRVLDESDQPIAGATVSIRHRHHDLEFLQAVGTYRAAPKVTDADGRFRFDGLLTGAYTLDVAADGFDKASLEFVRAGTDKADARLQPVKERSCISP